MSEFLLAQAFTPDAFEGAKAIRAGEFSLVQRKDVTWLYHVSGEGMQLSPEQVAEMFESYFNENF